MVGYVAAVSMYGSTCRGIGTGRLVTLHLAILHLVTAMDGSGSGRQISWNPGFEPGLILRGALWGDLGEELRVDLRGDVRD